MPWCWAGRPCATECTYTGFWRQSRARSAETITQASAPSVSRQLSKRQSGCELPRSVSHPFYEKLNRLLAEHGFDDFVEAQCRPFYAEKMGRPSLAPGQYFRLL